MSHESVSDQIRSVQKEQEQNQFAQEELKRKFEAEKGRLIAKQLELVQKEKKLFEELRSLKTF